MSKKRVMRVLSAVLGGVMSLSACSSLLVACKEDKNKAKRDSIVIMTEEWKAEYGLKAVNICVSRQETPYHTSVIRKERYIVC